MTASDEVLVERVLAGRLEAFEALMERYQRPVYRLAYGFCRDREDALDLTQDTFLKAYRGLATLDERRGFKPWLMRVATNEAINWHRRRSRRAAEVQGDEEQEVAAMETQHGDVLRSERGRMVQRVLGDLNPRQRLALELRYFRDLPIREVASALRCTEGTAKSILFRGMQRLREGVLALER